MAARKGKTRNKEKTMRTAWIAFLFLIAGCISNTNNNTNTVVMAGDDAEVNQGADEESPAHEEEVTESEEVSSSPSPSHSSPSETEVSETPVDNDFDQDDDGWIICYGGATEYCDCDDTDASINPWAVDVADGIDNDCDGMIDEAPDNDMFASRIDLGVFDVYPIVDWRSTFNATVEADEPMCGSMGSTVWYQFMSNESEVIVVSTTGSDFDTMLGIYTGDGADLANLEMVDCIDDRFGGLQAIVDFEATANTTYFIQAGGFGGAQGNLQLYVGPLDEEEFESGYEETEAESSETPSEEGCGI